VTLALPTTYRADATLVLARRGAAPGEDASLAGAAEAAAALLRSRAVAEAAAAHVVLDDPPEELLDRIDVHVGPRSSLLRLSVNGDDREEARLSAQEVAQVFRVLYNERFGPRVTASLWEEARARSEPVSPRPVLNLALGGLFGAAVGVAVAALRRPGRPGNGLDPLSERIAALTARERALARRAAELSLRERDATEPIPAAASPPDSDEGFVRPERGEWTVGDVERLVTEHGPAFADRADELRTYVDSIRAWPSPTAGCRPASKARRGRLRRSDRARAPGGRRVIDAMGRWGW
jgi:hypothetical protein